MEAYAAYRSRLAEASRKPLPPGSTYPQDADFSAVTFDPLRADLLVSLDVMVKSGSISRGTPPVSHVRVTSVQLDTTRDQPWPTVTLTDCLSGIDGWEEVDAKTGTPLEDVKQKVPPPYLSTITVIYYQQHWGVRTSKDDLTRTCAPDDPA